MGYKPAETFADIALKIKALFKETEEKECFDLAYKLAFLLAEGVFTKGYRSYVPWDTERAKSDEDLYRWGTSICNEPEGTAVILRNAVFIASNKNKGEVKNSEIKEIYNLLQPLDRNVLKVLFALYELTVDSAEHYVSAEEISEKCCLSVSAVEHALDNMPVQLCQKDGKIRIDKPYMQIPQLLQLLPVKKFQIFPTFLIELCLYG